MAKTPKKMALGKGLAALLGEEGIPGVNPLTSDGSLGILATGSDSLSVPIESLKAGKFQPRKEFNSDALEDLAASIRANGVIQPILVRKTGSKSSLYEIIAGERRWRAAQLAQLHEVPVLIRDFDDQKTLEIAIVENIQREDLNPLEEAEGYIRLSEAFSYTQEKIAKISGKSRPHIANMMRLVQLPEAIRNMLRDGRLSAGHARALIGATDPEKLSQAVVNLSLNVRQTEALVKKEGLPKPEKTHSDRSGETADPNIRDFERDLEASLGLKVQLTSKGEKGILNLHYQSLDQLESIVEKLKG